MKRNVIIILTTAVLTSVGLLYWLHDGDLEDAVIPVVEQWTQPSKTPTDKENDVPAL